METKELVDAMEKLKFSVVHALTKYVRDNGKFVTDYDRIEFGLDDDLDGTITKVLSIHGNKGCFFPTTRSPHTELDPFDKTDGQLEIELSDKFMFWAFQCLYIVVEDGKEILKYYTLYNDGTWFSENLAEPEHEYVSNLPLEVICKIIDAIKLWNI